MPRLALVARLVGTASVLAALGSACGGQSFTSPDGAAGSTHAEGGSTSDAGASTGGKAQGGASSGGSDAAGTASTAGFAGTGTGGTGSGGDGAAGGRGGNANAGTSGTGGAGGDACSGPSENAIGGASCTAAFPYWTHDAKTGVCMPIIYGGCGGTHNLYKTLQACQAACPSGATSYDACQVATDCKLGSPGCCGVCDGPGVTAHDFVAYNKQYEGKVTTCPGGVACGACPPPAAGTGTINNFLPNCVQGRCVVEDLRTSSVTACKSLIDCRVRVGTGCCPSCNGGDVIAVRTDGSFEDLVCGNARPPCAACAPDPSYVASCGADGHCQVGRLTP